MPDPFRHYEGVPVLDLPADPPVPGASAPVADGATFLSQLLFYSAAISASKGCAVHWVPVRAAGESVVG